MINIYSYILGKKSEKILEFWLQGNDEMRNAKKRELLEDVAFKSRSKDLLEATRRYMDDIVNSLRNVKTKVLQYYIETDGPLTIARSGGMGIIPFEIGIAFDWLLNVPYIPGSSIKGSMRRSLDGGSTRRKDFFTVYDAYPVETSTGYLLVPEVITPHYKDVETELDVKPNPLVHLVVPPGVVFRVIISIDEDCKRNLESIKNAFRSALRRGIGAKTSVGYSYFRLVREVE